MATKATYCFAGSRRECDNPGRRDGNLPSSLYVLSASAKAVCGNATIPVGGMETSKSNASASERPFSCGNATIPVGGMETDQAVLGDGPFFWVVGMRQSR